MEKDLKTSDVTVNISSVDITQPAAHTTDMTPVVFTEKDTQEIAAIKTTLDPTNIDSVYSFGQAPSEKISTFSDTILQMSKGKDIGEFGSQLGTMVNTARSLNFQGLSSERSNIPFIGSFIDKFKQKAGDIRTQFDTVAGQIDQATKSMDITERNLNTRVQTLEEMFELNREEYFQFSKYLAAGREALAKHEAQLAIEKAGVSSDTDPMEVQRINDYGKFVECLGNRLHDLEIVKVICTQTAAEIRMIQSNNRSLIGQYKDIKSITIPAWKKQLTLYLANNEQKLAAKTAHDAKDFTNQLLAQNAETLGANSISIAESNQRAIVDVATLEKVNNSLVEAFLRTQQIEKEGRARREQESVRLSQLSDELKMRLRNASEKV